MQFPRLKEVDDVLGGQAAWENVDATEGLVDSFRELTVISFIFVTETCPRCEHSKAYFVQMQTRSADEPMTIFYKCCNPDCSHRWKE